ncbi:hypothetical protein J6E39_08030 [bacterium]|nr:hypothetical protein [bacterium]
MNITLHGYKPNLTQGGLSDYKFPQNHPEKNAGLCDKNNNRGKSVAFSGSLAGASKTASFIDRLYTNKTFGNFLVRAQEHNISTSALVALGLAGVLRPATILALPGEKDKDDKTYAAGHSFASALVGFVASVILTSPLDTAITKLYEDKKEFLGSKRLKDIQEKINEKEALKKAKQLDKAGQLALDALYAQKATIKTLVKNIPGFVIAIPRAMLTIALIPPILKYVFGVEKKKKPEANANQTAQAQTAPQNTTDKTEDKKAENMQYTNNITQNSVFESIMKGGLK